MRKSFKKLRLCGLSIYPARTERHLFIQKNANFVTLFFVLTKNLLFNENYFICCFSKNFTLSKFLFTKRIGGLALQITFIQLIMHRAENI